MENLNQIIKQFPEVGEVKAVSYTHLDVYKRQTLFFADK